jgi:tRNA(adenine34) deaminase
MKIGDQSDARYMRGALSMARRAARRGEVPVGAVLVRDGQVIARAANAVEASNDPTQHAEIRVIRRACRIARNWRLVDCTLYVTKEPCPMCAGALALARVKRIVFGAPDPVGGGCGSKYSIATDGSQRHKVEIQGGVLKEECSQLLRKFFQAQRAKR